MANHPQAWPVTGGGRSEPGGRGARGRGPANGRASVLPDGPGDRQQRCLTQPRQVGPGPAGALLCRRQRQAASGPRRHRPPARWAAHGDAAENQRLRPAAPGAAHPPDARGSPSPTSRAPSRSGREREAGPATVLTATRGWAPGDPGVLGPLLRRALGVWPLGRRRGHRSRRPRGSPLCPYSLSPPYTECTAAWSLTCWAVAFF